mgnify:CR=1 FL=1
MNGLERTAWLVRKGNAVMERRRNWSICASAQLLIEGKACGKAEWGIAMTSEAEK